MARNDSPNALIAENATRLVQRLLDPEDFGHAVTPEIRDAARQVLGYTPVETTRSKVNAALNDMEAEISRLTALINTPEIHDFAKGVTLEAVHQREKWGSDHDAGKTVWDWFWLIGYLAQKAADAFQRGDIEKALHHTITTAAACANWHAAMLGLTNMRPGIDTSALAPGLTTDLPFIPQPQPERRR
jgi:hypothetical protein